MGDGNCPELDPVIPLNLLSDSPSETQLPPWGGGRGRRRGISYGTLPLSTLAILEPEHLFTVLGSYTIPVSLLLPRRSNPIVSSSPYCSLRNTYPIIAPGGIYTALPSLVISGQGGGRCYTALLLLCLDPDFLGHPPHHQQVRSPSGPGRSLSL